MPSDPIAGLLARAWAKRCVLDVAFISFRSARILVDGIGLAWNPGERVEGYTNFLWTLLVAAGMQFGADPVVFTQTLGLLLFACSLILLWRIGSESGLGTPAALVAIMLTGTNHTFSCYATGGLETPLVTTIFLAGCLVAVRVLSGRSGRERGLLILSFLCTAGILTRMDTAVLFVGPVLAVFVGGPAPAPGPDTGHRILPNIARIALFPIMLAGCWLAWKYFYYGDLLPRAFYLKAVNASSLERGLRYFYEFIVSYNLAPFLFFCIFFFGPLFKKENRTQFMMAATVSLWFVYVLKVGGDFMEFRFMTPVIPLMMILLVWILFNCTAKAWLRTASVVLVLGGSFHHATTFTYDRETGVEPVGMLERHLHSPEENWVGIGKALARAFRPEDGVVIATTAAGAIPYYSGLRSVDMLGLNEPPEKEGSGTDGESGGEPEGVFAGYIPGHQKVLTYEYLNRKSVNLVISHPVVTRVGDPPGTLPFLPAAGPPHLAGKVIRFPIGGGYQVEMLYIRPNAAVDSALARYGWPARTVVF